MAAEQTSERALSERERCFIEEYLIDLNASAAAVRAGYSPKSAPESGSELLARPRVQEALKAARAQRVSRVNMRQDAVLQEMALLSHSSISHYRVDDEGNVQLAEGAPHGAMRAIQSIKRRVTIKMDKDDNLIKTYDVEIKLWDKPAPLKLMGRHLGLFPDRVEVTGPNGGPVETVVTRIERVIVDPKHGEDVTDRDAAGVSAAAQTESL